MGAKKDPPKRTIAVTLTQENVDRLVNAAGGAGLTVHQFCERVLMKGVKDAGC